MQQKQPDDLRDKRVKNLQEQIENAEKIAYALKTEAGKTILSALFAESKMLTIRHDNICLQELQEPFYEYSKEDLNKMRSFKAQMARDKYLLSVFNADKLLEVAKTKRLEAQAYTQGEPARAAYS